MLVLRCTHRVLSLFGQKRREVSVSPEGEGLGEWYVRVADESDGVLFVCTNARSLYTLILGAEVHGLKSVQDLAEAMLRRLFQHLYELGVEGASLSRIAEDYAQLVVGKSASRSVIGSMNDLMEHLYFHAGQQMADTGKLDLRAIEEELNVIPQCPIGWAFAKDRLVELCSRM